MDKILSILGLTRISTVRDLNKEPFTEDEFDSMYVEIAHKRAENFDKDKYDLMIDLLRKNPEFAQFLDWTIDQDVLRSFNVTDAERQVVRGAVSRTRYLRSLCLPEGANVKVFNKRIKRNS